MTPRRPNKRDVKRELNDLDPTEGDGYGGIWCAVNPVDGDRQEPDRDVAPDDLVVTVTHVEVPPADDESGDGGTGE